MKGQTPGVSPQDVYQERRRRAEMGLDPDYYTNPLEDIGLIQRTPEAKKDLQERIDAVKNTRLCHLVLILIRQSQLKILKLR